MKEIKRSENGLYRTIYSEHYNLYKVQRKEGIWKQIAEYKTEKPAINYMNKISK